MEWVSDGRRRRADFTVALPAAEAARRLRTALDPEGDWVAHVLSDAHRELIDLRAGAHHDAGGLVIAADKEHAEKLADRLARIAGERPEIVTSDAPDASARIGRFAAGSGTWLVSVLMVSEGVDVPRLRVGVYATSARTELFFRQVVGRFIRRTPGAAPSDVAPVPAQRPDAQAARGQIEEERNHALVAKPEGEAIERGERGEAGDPFHALSSSARRDDDVLQTTAARRRAAAVRRRRARPVAGAGRVRRRHHLHDDRHDPRLGPVAPGRRDRLREARAPARGAPQPRQHDLAPHRRGAPRDQRPRQPRRRRALGRQGDRGAAREGQPPARARGRAR